MAELEASDPLDALMRCAMDANMVLEGIRRGDATETPASWSLRERLEQSVARVSSGFGFSGTAMRHVPRSRKPVREDSDAAAGMPRPGITV